MAETYYSLTEIIKLCDNLVAAMPTSFYNGIMAVRGGLATAPAADVVPVVRCGECKYWEESSVIQNIGTCVFTPIRHTAEFFCADGVRKDGDGYGV